MLFRGADKEALNYAGQTAYQVAVIAGNLELAEVIKNHRSEDIGKFLIDFNKSISLGKNQRKTYLIQIIEDEFKHFFLVLLIIYENFTSLKCKKCLTVLDEK